MLRPRLFPEPEEVAEDPGAPLGLERGAHLGVRAHHGEGDTAESLGLTEDLLEPYGRAIAKIGDLKPPAEPRTTFTVGTVPAGLSARYSGACCSNRVMSTPPSASSSAKPTVSSRRLIRAKAPRSRAPDRARVVAPGRDAAREDHALEQRAGGAIDVPEGNR